MRRSSAGVPAPPTEPSGLRIALLLGSMIALTVIGSSAIAVALPQLAGDLGLSTAASAWVLAAFGLTFALGTAVFGRLADLAGLRLPLLLGVALLTAGSAISAVATSFPLLVAGRLLQGAGGGSVPVLSVAIVHACLPPGHRARALGALTALVTTVSASGPLIGGALTQVAGWRSVLAVPMIAPALLVPIARLVTAAPATEDRLDTTGLVLVAVAVGGLMLLLQGPAQLGAGGTLVTGAVAAGAAVLLVRHVRDHPDGFLPRAVVTSGRLLRASLAGATLIAAYICALFSLPKILSLDPGWPPLAIGAAMLPAAALGAVASRVAGTLVGRRNSRLVVVAAAASCVAGLVVAGLAAPSVWLMVAGFGLVASGFGAGQVVLIDAVPGLVPPEVRGSALGVFNLVFFTGSAVGTAAIGGLVPLLGVPAALATIAVLPAAGIALAASVDTDAGRLADGGGGR